MGQNSTCVRIVSTLGVLDERKCYSSKLITPERTKLFL